MKTLTQLLTNYQPATKEQETLKLRFLDFMSLHEDHLHRSCVPGHITASACVLDPTGTEVLLMHHKKLDKWLQPGGHADGEKDIIAVARKEVREETGMRELLSCSEGIFDLDIHPIPARGTVPTHLHYDVRFLFQARSAVIEQNHESYELRWIKLSEVSSLTSEASVLRMTNQASDYVTS